MPQPPYDVDIFLFKKRNRKTRRERVRQAKRFAREADREFDRKSNFGKRSRIINMLSKSAKYAMPASRIDIKVRIKKRFSIIEDPKSALELISSFALALRQGQSIRAIRFHHENLETYDLAANALLDLVAVERKVELRNRGSRKGLRVSGMYPRDANVRRFIKAMGIIKHMEIEHEAPSNVESEKIHFFDRRNTHYLRNPDANRADFKDKIQAKFVDFIDGCLKSHDWVLSDIGKQALGVYAGEILANAEDHAGFVDWTVQGFLDNSLDIPICEIAIFNFGKSIADTFLDLDRSHYAWREPQMYVDLHKKKGFFGNGWREEDLLTVVALQQHISSKNTSEVDSRGQGTVQFIDFFQQVHRRCTNNGREAKMAIVSGSTYILFDGTYELKERLNGGKIIAFNPSDDLTERPDPNYVKNLDGVHFPGTIISVRFPLSLGEGSMVEELQDEQNDN